VKVYKLNKIKREEVKEIAKEIKNGKIAVFPTDTIYGIGTNAFRWQSVRNICKIKRRNEKKPMPILVDSIEKIKKIVKRIPSDAEKLIKKYWPGPLTLVFETNELGTMLMGGKKSVAARIPNNNVLLSIIKEMGCPLIGTSLGISGIKEYSNISNLDKKLQKEVDIIIDGGKTKIGKSSTVLDLSRYPYTIVRIGAISKKEIEKFMKI